MMTSGLEKRTPIHHDSPYLPQRGDPGQCVNRCPQKCSLCCEVDTVIAVIIALPVQRQGKKVFGCLVIVCEKVEKQGG